MVRRHRLPLNANKRAQWNLHNLRGLCLPVDVVMSRMYLLHLSGFIIVIVRAGPHRASPTARHPSIHPPINQSTVSSRGVGPNCPEARRASPLAMSGPGAGCAHGVAFRSRRELRAALRWLEGPQAGASGALLGRRTHPRGVGRSRRCAVPVCLGAGSF